MPEPEVQENLLSRGDKGEGNVPVLRETECTGEKDSRGLAIDTLVVQPGRTPGLQPGGTGSIPVESTALVAKTDNAPRF